MCVVVSSGSSQQLERTQSTSHGQLAAGCVTIDTATKRHRHRPSRLVTTQLQQGRAVCVRGENTSEGEGGKGWFVGLFGAT